MRPTRTPIIRSFALIAAVFATSGLGLALPAGANELPPVTKKEVEIVFALDTTGSMGGLLEGAKQKIWFVANEVMKAKQAPTVKIGLVAYRDVGDEYVTKVLPLTDDLDKVYETLMSYRAAGGGDGPEHVNAALRDAIEKQPWTDSKDVLKLVFLVGDAPPHMDYPDDVQHAATSQAAIRRNIYINTIQCGRDSTTTKVWKEIAHNSEGRYAAIAQDGGVVAVATPFDEDLRMLGTELDGTRLVYGSHEKKAERRAAYGRASGLSARAPSSAAADRAVAKSKAVASADEDLVSLVEESGAGEALAAVNAEALPDELAGKTAEEQKAVLDAMAKKRQALQTQIASVSKKRDAWLAEETAKKAKAGAKEGFDTEVVEMLHAEAARVGITY